MISWGLVIPVQYPTSWSSKKPSLELPIYYLKIPYTEPQWVDINSNSVVMPIFLKKKQFVLHEMFLKKKYICEDITIK